MKRITCIILLSIMITTIQAQFSNDDEIKAFISEMSLKEKVGQMTQVTLDYICEGQHYDMNKEMILNEELLKKAVVEYGVGSVFNTGQYALDREKWFQLIEKIQSKATKDTRLHIPVLYGVDAIHGANYTANSTLFPQQVATAATWDPKFAEKCGEVTAYETRASGIPWNFSPVLDLGRQPLWSRHFETFGEDPYLATQMGDAIIRGYQGTDVSAYDKVAACLKHYVGYSNSRTGKDRTPIQMSERELQEYYLVPFKSAIDQGALSVMINSTEINGTPVHADHHLLTEVLKDELGLKGFTVTDWEDIIMLHTVHRVAKDEKEAVELAVNAGVDMSMVPYGLQFADYLVELVEEGKVPMSRIDDAVFRILYVKNELGLFKTVYHKAKKYPDFGSEKFANESYLAALETMTLLKNENKLLPLNKEGTKLFVTGAGANTMVALDGAWSRTWQGKETRFDTPGKKTVYEALKDKFTIVGDKCYPAVDFATKLDDYNEALKVAADAEVIIVCLAEEPGTEKPGDIEDLSFEKVQLDLIKDLSKTGKPIIALIMSTRPRLFTEVEPLLSGVINMYWSGSESGRALATILKGEVSPSGKLPYTYPRYSGSLLTYDYKYSETRDKKFGHNAVNPLYEFGYGMSYTTFKYEDFKVDKTLFDASDELTISVKLTNTGKMKAKEVVQLYSRDHFASITPSIKRLRRFQKVALESGESKIVSFKLTAKDLAFVNNKLEWITEEGAFDLQIDKFIQEVTFTTK